MLVEQRPDTILQELIATGVDFVVVGGSAAVLQGANYVTDDLDIVHRRTPENVARLLPWLLSRGAYNRSDLANRRLPPNESALLGHGHVNLMTDLGKLDVLCELAVGEGYEQILEDTVRVRYQGMDLLVLGLPRLIAVKARAGRPKDRMALPVLIAALDEKRAAEKRAAAGPPPIASGATGTDGLPRSSTPASSGWRTSSSIS